MRKVSCALILQRHETDQIAKTLTQLLEAMQDQVLQLLAHLQRPTQFFLPDWRSNWP